MWPKHAHAQSQFWVLGRRERIEKGSRERKEKETKQQFEEKEGLRGLPFIELSRSNPAM